MTLVEKHTLGDNFDFAAFLAEWIATDWKAVGVEDAGKCQELAECGYSNPQSNGTPWSDGEPDAARGTKYLTFDFDLTPEEEESWKAAEHDAINKYNAGFVEAENKAIEQLAAERAADLARADAAGWRICQFGLPGQIPMSSVSRPWGSRSDQQRNLSSRAMRPIRLVDPQAERGRQCQISGWYGGLWGRD